MLKKKHTIKELAQMFNVSHTTIIRWNKLFKK